MTTFNITPTNPTGTVHKRQTGLWGQLLASAEIERKLARVEPLFKELHGRGLNRTAFFGKCRECFAIVGPVDKLGGKIVKPARASIVDGELLRLLLHLVKGLQLFCDDVDDVHPGIAAVGKLGLLVFKSHLAFEGGFHDAAYVLQRDRLFIVFVLVQCVGCGNVIVFQL